MREYSETVNKSNYFLSIETPFWIRQYWKNPITKPILDARGSEETIEHFHNNSEHPEKFSKKHNFLMELLKNPHEKQKIYLVYAEGEFNKPEVAQLIKSTMQKYSGCDVEIHEWKSIRHIPETHPYLLHFYALTASILGIPHYSIF